MGLLKAEGPPQAWLKLLLNQRKEALREAQFASGPQHGRSVWRLTRIQERALGHQKVKPTNKGDAGKRVGAAQAGKGGPRASPGSHGSPWGGLGDCAGDEAPSALDSVRKGTSPYGAAHRHSTCWVSRVWLGLVSLACCCSWSTHPTCAPHPFTPECSNPQFTSPLPAPLTYIGPHRPCSPAR